MLFRKITGLMGALVAVVLSSTAFPKEINWTKVEIPNGDTLTSIVASQDGTKIAGYYKSVYTSSDTGKTWTKREPAGIDVLKNWSSIACSSDGVKIAICASSDFKTPGDFVYTSSDNGTTWLKRDPTGTGEKEEWFKIVMSSDGNTILCIPKQQNYIYKSSDSGETWTTLEPPLTSISEIACSADASKIIADSFISEDGGNSWSTMGINCWKYFFDSTGNKIAGVDRSDDPFLVITDDKFNTYTCYLLPLMVNDYSYSFSRNTLLLLDGGTFGISYNSGLSMEYYGFGSAEFYGALVPEEGNILYLCAGNYIYIGEVQGSSGDYTLTVSDGTGTGNYNSGDYATITANDPPSGKIFDKWTGFNVQSPFSKTTVLQMPSKDTGVTATYKDVITYALTVTTGSGGGDYAAGESVIISADDPPSGQVFNAWTDFQVTNPSSSSTTLTMPANAVTVTATFRSQSDTTYTLTVENGSGSGTYSSGTVITIKANPPDAGKIFSQWTGATVTDPTSQETTITMPDSNTTVTATYSDIGWTPKVKFTSGHKENAKGEKESYSVNTSFKFPEGGTVTPITFMNSQTKVVISLGNWQYSGTLGDDPKAKFTDKKGSSKQAAINGDTVSIQWSSKKINVTVKSNQGMNSGQNILDLSGQTGDINGTLENCIISFDDIEWNGSVNYSGKAKIDKKNYQSWNVKVK